MTRLPRASLPSTTPSSHPSSPLVCPSSPPCRSAPPWLPSCSGTSRTLRWSSGGAWEELRWRSGGDQLELSWSSGGAPPELHLSSVCLSQLTGPSCPPLWRLRLPYVRCVVGPDLSSGRKVKMSVSNEMRPVLLNNIFSSVEGRLEPGTRVQPEPDWSLRDPGLSVRPVHHPGSPEGLAGSRSRQVWSRDGCPAGAGSDLLSHGEKR